MVTSGLMDSRSFLTMREPVTVTSPSSVALTLALSDAGVELDDTLPVGGDGGVCATAHTDQLDEAINPHSRPGRTRSRTIAETLCLAKIISIPLKPRYKSTTTDISEPPSYRDRVKKSC
jgi:hypothetical protein